MVKGKNWPYEVNTQLTLQRWHNVVTTLVPTLWQRSLVDTFKCPSNVVWPCRQCYVNIESILYFNQNPNVATPLANISQHCDNGVAMFRKCCVNNVGTSLPNTNIKTTFRQCCVNITWCPKLTDFRTISGNDAWTMHERCILYAVILIPELQLHSKFNFPHICNINMHLYIGTMRSTNIHE